MNDRRARLLSTIAGYGIAYGLAAIALGLMFYGAATCTQAASGMGTDAPLMEMTQEAGIEAPMIPPVLCCEYGEDERLNAEPCAWPDCVRFTDGPMADGEYMDSEGTIFVAPLLPLGVYRSPCQEDEVLYPVNPVTGALAFPEGVLTCVHMDTFR